MPLQPGTRLGAYEIIAPVGSGGMGEVYRAHDSRLGRDIAIKVLPSSLTNDPSSLARFEREAKAIGALNHPTVVNVFDVGSENGVSFVVMELIEGETLRARLQGTAAHTTTPSTKTPKARRQRRLAGARVAEEEGARDRAPDRAGTRRGARAGDRPSESRAREHLPDARPPREEEGSARRLFVRPNRGSGARIPVTAGFANYPRWRGDGRELYFVGSRGATPPIMAVPVAWTAAGPDFGLPTELFKVERPAFSNIGFDVGSDGQRFVFILEGPPDPSPLTVLVRDKQ